MEQIMPKILYEDNHLIAVWKDAGILAQGDDSSLPSKIFQGKILEGRSVMDDVKKYLKEKYKKPGNVFLGLLHRLDRPVAGIMLFAKTSKGASRLSEQFRERMIVKTYYAVIEGKMPDKNGILVHMIEKKTTMHGGRRAKIVKRAGDQAELSYETIRSGIRYSLVKINLKTGKFHQIRAQFAATGHPVTGDLKYGGHTSPVLTDGTIALAACGLTFMTATGDQKISLKEPYPKEWNELL
jgi:23S rRNA pseudouridine1911/1915/1917 synthase